MLRRFLAALTNSPSQAREAILAVTQSAADSDCLQSIASNSGWELRLAADCHSAASILHERKFGVVFCDRDLSGQDWRDSLRLLHSAAGPCCVVLASHVNDDYLWQEVVHLGGYDVIAKPFREEQVVSLVRRALIFRNAGFPRPPGIRK